MNMVQMRATGKRRLLGYNRRQLAAGDRFEASDKDARLLSTMGLAEVIVGDDSKPIDLSGVVGSDVPADEQPGDVGTASKPRRGRSNRYLRRDQRAQD